jgi:hypothetical protein
VDSNKRKEGIIEGIIKNVVREYFNEQYSQKTSINENDGDDMGIYTKFLMTKFMTFAIVMVLMCKPK